VRRRRRYRHRQCRYAYASFAAQTLPEAESARQPAVSRTGYGSLRPRSLLPASNGVGAAARQSADNVSAMRPGYWQAKDRKDVMLDYPA
jgi:hypothetical protein